MIKTDNKKTCCYGTGNNLSEVQYLFVNFNDFNCIILQ